MTRAHGRSAPAPSASDDRLYAPAARRNGEALLRVLCAVLPADASVLEIASGTGQHAALLAEHLPGMRWRPSEIDPRLRASIRAWCEPLPAGRVDPPLDLDVTVDGWWREVNGAVDAILEVNLLHCAPRTALDGLLAGAGALLPVGGPLVLYGPFMFNGSHVGPGNRAFDRMLRQQDGAWGLRDLNDIASAAPGHGMRIHEIVEMPADNHVVILHRL